MLKTRLIPCLLLQNGLLVRSEEFSFHQVIGNPINQVERSTPGPSTSSSTSTSPARASCDMRRDDHKVKGAGDLLASDRGDLALVLHAADLRRRHPRHRGDARPLRPRCRQGHPEHRCGRDPGAGHRGLAQLRQPAIIVSIDAKRREPGQWEVCTRWGQAGDRARRGRVGAARPRRSGPARSSSTRSMRTESAGGYDLPLIEAVFGGRPGIR